MKLAFICGNLSPGTDGVGDYTRMLATTLAGKGIECALISLCDRETSNESSFGTVLVERISKTAGLTTALFRLSSFLANWRPDWASFQFVPYAFQPKGLPFKLSRQLPSALRSLKCQIMFHELWIGESTEYGIKDRIIGWIQRQLILQLVHNIRPSCIHTSNPVYSQMLLEKGIANRILPLFSNIPFAKNADSDWFHNKLERADVGYSRCSHFKYVIAGMFGLIHPQWDHVSFFRQFAAAAEDAGKIALFLGFGRPGVHGSEVVFGRESYPTCGVQRVHLGEFSPAEISQILQNLNFGISASPLALVGKSGAAMAMLEHGLPVVVTRDDWKRRCCPTPPPENCDRYLSIAALPSLCRNMIPRRPNVSGALQTASCFLRDLGLQ